MGRLLALTVNIRLRMMWIEKDAHFSLVFKSINDEKSFVTL